MYSSEQLIKNLTDVHLLYSYSEQLLKYLSAVYLEYPWPEQFLIYFTTLKDMNIRNLRIIPRILKIFPGSLV